jgi:2-oxoisovalerate dehydrogenase E2 component (dihydrolipoyl transacylase)
LLQLVVVFLEELRGATITLSSFGMIGGRLASLVVVPPQVAIVGAGRIAEMVVALSLSET